MEENKKLLYEKIANISETKSQLQEENEILKKQINEYHDNIFDDFCEFVNVLMEKADFSKEEIDEGIFGEQPREKQMAKFFIKAIKDRASKEGIDPKEVVRNISAMLRVF